jgi:hypothetical protein
MVASRWEEEMIPHLVLFTGMYGWHNRGGKGAGMEQFKKEYRMQQA